MRPALLLAMAPPLDAGGAAIMVVCDVSMSAERLPEWIKNHGRVMAIGPSFAETPHPPDQINVLISHDPRSGLKAISGKIAGHARDIKPARLVWLAVDAKFDLTIAELLFLIRLGVRSLSSLEGMEWKDASLIKEAILRLGFLPARALKVTAWLLSRFIGPNASVIRKLDISRARVAEWGYSLMKSLLCENPKITGDPSALVKQLKPRATAILKDGVGKLKVTQYIGSLGPGGAERQLCNLSSALKKSGHDVKVMTACELTGDLAHYLPILVESGVSARMAGEDYDESRLSRLKSVASSARMDLLRLAPPDIESYTLALAAELALDTPDVLHCWLDLTNIAGAIAGHATGVPRIVMSLRNMNPERFPRLFHPWYLRWYRIFADSDRVRLVANSQAGAEDYARWIGCAPDKIRVARNGYDFTALRSLETQRGPSLRDELNITADRKLVGGVFRLDAEKRPLDFLRVVKALKESAPNVAAVIAGIGSLMDETRRAAHEMGLDGTVFFLGRRENIYDVMRDCDALLLTSEYEGSPNAVIEAQFFQIPVVVTRAGGADETIYNGESGFAFDVGDTRGMANALAGILGDEALRKRMGERGRKFVTGNFSITRMVEDTVRLYFE